MRIIIYDNGEVFVPDKLIGFMGETNRTIDFSFEYVQGATNYVLRIEYSDGLVYDVSIINKVAALPVSVLREAGKVKAQWVAFASDGEAYTLVAKSQTFELIIGASVGDDITDIPTYEQIMSAVNQLVDTGMTKEQVITAIEQIVRTGEVEDLDTGFVTTLKEINNGVGFRIWLGTCAQYQTLVDEGLVENNVLYIRTDDTTADELRNDVDEANNKIQFLGTINDKTPEEIYRERQGSNVILGYRVTNIQDTTVYPLIVAAYETAFVEVTILAYQFGRFRFTYGAKEYIKTYHAGPSGGWSNWVEITNS